jgi:hypothetical protein
LSIIPKKQSESKSLRRDNPTQRMPPRQHNAAMIHLNRSAPAAFHRLNRLPLRQSPSASRTPIRPRIGRKRRMALSTNPFHV